MDSLSEPLAIEKKSMEIIEELLGDIPWNNQEKLLVKRIVHATGDAALARLVAIHPEAIRAAFTVFSSSKKIITDVKMVKAGLNINLIRQEGIEIYCAIDNPLVIEEARTQKQTRARAAIKHLAKYIPGSMVVIGNAPTALAELVALIKADKVKPGVVIGTPVGFVGAAEAKLALSRLAVPYITVHGAKGGSTIAVSIVNGLYQLYRQG